jgi:hypothetical protein
MLKDEKLYLETMATMRGVIIGAALGFAATSVALGAWRRDTRPDVVRSEPVRALCPCPVTP